MNNTTAQSPLFPGRQVCLPDGALVVTNTPVAVIVTAVPAVAPAPQKPKHGPKPAPPAQAPNASSGGS